ncbi:U-box domain-containing protein 7-like [Rhodamnia argentea]|uniref:U-box domain-containing protein 7-like n=1 Tax=Rhodamnia argentea TaxID=178133 RepID=A0ABM3H396_9MYRT|nr:U-box domain-containing protein 7-like [Rhodamnia argentea]
MIILAFTFFISHFSTSPCTFLHRSLLEAAVCSPCFFFLRNKELILAAGVVPLLQEMTSNHDSHPSATALYLNLSCLEDAKPVLGLSQAVPFLTQLLKDETAPQCKLDAIHALYNLSTYHDNIGYLPSAGIISGLQSLLADLVTKCGQKSQ